MTWAAAPKPALTNTTVRGEAVTSESAGYVQKKRKGSRWEEHTRRRRKQSRILIINTKTNSQDGQNVEYNDPEKSGFDRSWDALVGLSGFSSCNGNELDTPIGEKSKRESLCKGRKATYECLGVLEIG